ncbi:MAG: GyrI-like domain-containing protein [Rhodobacteraceae bacterium]|nr:GyrI-like domain-containing protein [Paracoccaceae bacterium]
MAHTLTREEIKELYRPPAGQIVEVDVPVLKYLVIDGEGDPAAKPFREATRWLFAAIVPLRKIAKQKLGQAFAEPPLEAVYWTKGAANLDTAPKSEWCWRCMIVLADWMDEAMIADAIDNAVKVLGKAPDSLRVEEMHEGRSVQIMHAGTPENDRDLIAKIYQDYLPARDLAPSGLYHEIYLGDARRVPPEKMRTIVRQPVA